MNTGYKEASKITPENYNGQFSLLKYYTSLGKTSEAFGVLKKMKENGNDEFAFIPSDLYKDHPEYVTMANNIARMNSHKDTKEFDVLKKSQIYLQFEKGADGKYNGKKVTDKIQAIASDPTKYKDLDFDSLAIFLDNNKDENGEILGADKGLMAFFSTAGKTFGGISALLRKPKIDKLNQFLTALNEKLPAGKNVFSDLSIQELTKVNNMYKTGKLSLIDQSHRDNLLDVLKQRGFSVNQETQVAQEKIDKAKKSTNKNEQIEVMRQMLEELREMNSTKSAPKEKTNF
jgi:pentatricopeptide repeat protein